MEENKLPYDSRQIANWFIRRSQKDGNQISIMRLLKLVYMAHGWTLALFDRPLIMDRIEAWEYGPVIPVVYFAFRPQQKNKYTIFSELKIYERELDEKIETLLEEVYDLYKGISTIGLSNLTHIKGGPWEIVHSRGKRYNEIPDELIKKHYKEKLKSE